MQTSLASWIHRYGDCGLVKFAQPISSTPWRPECKAGTSDRNGMGFGRTGSGDGDGDGDGGSGGGGGW